MPRLSYTSEGVTVRPSRQQEFDIIEPSSWMPSFIQIVADSLRIGDCMRHHTDGAFRSVGDRFQIRMSDDETLRGTIDGQPHLTFSIPDRDMVSGMDRHRFIETFIKPAAREYAHLLDRYIYDRIWNVRDRVSWFMENDPVEYLRLTSDLFSGGPHWSESKNTIIGPATESRLLRANYTHTRSATTTGHRLQVFGQGVIMDPSLPEHSHCMLSLHRGSCILFTSPIRHDIAGGTRAFSYSHNGLGITAFLYYNAIRGSTDFKFHTNTGFIIRDADGIYFNDLA